MPQQRAQPTLQATDHLANGTAVYVLYAGVWDADNQMVVENYGTRARPVELANMDGGFVLNIDELFDTVARLREAHYARLAKKTLVIAKGDSARTIVRAAVPQE